jgi:hypothetical protein
MPQGESISAAIELGCEGGAVAVSRGSVWVVPHLDRVALRIDPATNAVVDHVQLGDRGPGAEISATEEMIWASVSSPSYDLERLARIDPVTGDVTAWVDAPAGFPTIGADFVWAMGERGLYRIDPATNTVGSIIDVGDCGVFAIDERVFCIGPDVAVSIDPNNDSVSAVRGAPTNGRPIRVTGGVIWGVSGDTLWAFDPDTGNVEVELQPPEGIAMWGLEAAPIGDALWVGASSQPGDPKRTAPDRLVRVDLERRVVDCAVGIPTPEYGMAAGLGSIWFSVVREPWLVRVDPEC